jgi:hypothetical protein
MLDKEERTVALVENCPAGEAKGGLACGILLTVAVLSRPIGTLDQMQLVSEGQQSYLKKLSQSARVQRLGTAFD